jgi:cytochrome P450
VIPYADLPGPRGLPWLGSLHQVRFPKLHAWFEEQALRYGEVYRVRLGPARLTVVSDPVMIQAILKSRPGQFRRVSKLDKVIRAEGIHGLFNAEGEDWKVHRRIVTRGLDIRHQQRFFPTMTNILARLMDKMNRAARDGEPYAIQDDLMRFTVDVTTSLAFGIDMNTLEQKGGTIQAHMEKIFPTIFRRINAPISLYKYFPSRADRDYAQAMRVITGKVDEFIHAGRERLRRDTGLREQPGNILDALLVAADEEPLITDREIRSNLLTLLMAGEDTTAHSLAWAVVLLGRDPQLYKRLQEEADAVLGDRPYASAYDDLGGLRYTEAVIQETLRLKAVAPVMLVEPLSDVDVEGYRLAKGSRIVRQPAFLFHFAGCNASRTLARSRDGQMPGAPARRDVSLRRRPAPLPGQEPRPARNETRPLHAGEKLQFGTPHAGRRDRREHGVYDEPGTVYDPLARKMISCEGCNVKGLEFRV